MATTVRISDETKRKLDRLQAQALLRTGRKLSKEEILERLVLMGLADESWLTRNKARPRYPIPDRAWRKNLKRIQDWGVATREEDIDRILYGGTD